MPPSKKPFLCRLIWGAVDFFYPKLTVEGMENLPDSPCIVVGNHAQIHGPISSELRLPFPHDTWCIAEMLHREGLAEYAYQDFWSKKPSGIRWLFWIISRVIPLPASYILSHAQVIPVYHDSRCITTFRLSMERLQAGSSMVIFPEKDERDNGIVWQFQEHFVDLARLYHRKTGQCLSFVPMYIAPKLGRIFLGKPIRYNPEIPMEQQRQAICHYLMDAITGLAKAQPMHTVIPYPNIPKQDYPSNLSEGDYHETHRL